MIRRWIIEYDESEERTAMIHIKGMDWALALHDVAEKVRGWISNGHSFDSPEEALQEVQLAISATEEIRGVYTDEIP